MGILRKFQQYRRLPQDPPPGPPHHLEEELDRLTGKIVRISPPAPGGHQVTFCCQDSLLFKIEGQDQEAARAHEEECVVCGTNRASMQTLPCSHQVSRGGYSDIQGGYSDIDPALQPPGQQGGIFSYSGGIF